MQTSILDNQLSIVSEQIDIPISFVYACIGVGSIDDSIAGIAHFVEHCIFSGTEDHPDEVSVWKAIEEMGGTINAYTSKDHTIVFCTVLRNYMSQAARLVSQIVFTPKFEIQEVKKEIDIVKAELLKYSSSNKLNTSLLESLFGDHPVTKPILGIDASITKIQRQDLIEFHQKYYGPNNVTIAVVGPHTHEEVLQAWKDLPASAANNVKMEPEAALLQTSKHTTSKQKGKQGTILVGFTTDNIASKDALTIDLVTHALGEMATFGLRNLVRFDHGLAYGVKAAWNGYTTGSYSSLSIKAPQKNIEKINDLIQEFLEVFAEKVIREDVFSRILSSYLGKTYLKYQDIATRTKSLAHAYRFDAPHLLQIDEWAQSINRNTLLSVCERYFKNYALIKTLP